MFCASECAGGVNIPSLANVCDTVLRSECVSKLLFFTCPTEIPQGNEAALGLALAALITSGDLGATGRLRNFTFADPQTTDFAYNDCSPSVPVVTQRDLTFEDLNAIDVDAADAAAPYNDRVFWRTILKQGQKYNFAYTTCDGLMYLMTTDESNTAFATGIITMILGFDRTLPNKCTEIKRGTVRFLTDPLAHMPVPFIDLKNVEGVSPSLKTLY